MSTLAADLRYAFRMLRKTPGFTAIAVITLALGIGANTAIFSILNGVLLRPLPYRDPQRLVALREKSPDFENMSVSYPNFLDWRAAQTTFTDLAAFREIGVAFAGGPEPEVLSAVDVSAQWFDVLGVRPALGRAFTPDEDRLGAAPVAILSDSLWRRRFGADRSVLGKTVVLEGQSRQVVGVMPAGFLFRGARDVILPLGQEETIHLRNRDFHPGLTVIGRLKAGVPMTSAAADLNAIAARLAAAYPESNKGHTVTVGSFRDYLVRGGVRTTLWILLGAVGFVLLIACVNVANLLLARSTVRMKEIAIRTALGAGRRRIVDQMLAESLLLSLAGGALGLLIAAWGTGAAVAAVPSGLPRVEEVGIDGRVLAFTLAASLVTGLLFGILPALRAAHSEPAVTLRETGRAVAGGRQRLRDALVIAEMGLAMILLAGAGLMIRTMWSLGSVNPGLDPQHVITFEVSPSQAKTATPAASRAAVRRLLEAVRNTPGVENASVTDLLPLGGSDSEAPFWIEGKPRPRSQGEMNWALIYLSSSDYQRAMRIPLLKGRYFTDRDDEKSHGVALIDTEFARAIFPTENPIGKHILIPLGAEALPFEIVGVVGHVKHWGLDENASTPIRQQFYVPVLQVPDQLVGFLRGLQFVVRTYGPPRDVMPRIRAEIARESPEQPVHSVKTMDDVVTASTAERRFLLLLLGAFAAVALVLACVGIYGVISYAVGQRTQEIGIRMALGAERGEVLRMVVGKAAILAGAGVAIGTAGAIAATRAMRTVLFGVGPADPLTYLGVAAVLAFVALAASSIPAHRASRVDPLTALRYE